MPQSDHLAAFTRALQQLDGYNARVGAELAARYPTLTLQDLGALLALGSHGPSRMGWVAGHLGLAPASVTPIVDRLEDQGLARRSRSVADRRVWLVELAEAGEEIVADVNRLYQHVASLMLDALSEAEQETFVALFAKVVGGIGESEEPEA